MEDGNKASTSTSEGSGTKKDQKPDEDNRGAGKARLSGAMRRKLKLLKDSGVDITTLDYVSLKGKSIGTIVRGTPSGSFKRTASTRSTPTDQPSTSKRVRQEETSGTKLSYRSVVTGIRTAVVPLDYPKNIMTEEEAKKVKLRVTQKIDETGEEGPNFEGCRLIDGYLGFICVDRRSFTWLEDLLGSSGEYRVLEVKDLPNKIKVAALFPEKAETKIIFNRIETQNKSLKCSNWRVLGGGKVDDRGYSLILTIDEASKESLEKLNYRPFYLFHRAFFRVLEEKDRNKAGEEAMEVATEAGDGQVSTGQPPT